MMIRQTKLRQKRTERLSIVQSAGQQMSIGHRVCHSFGRYGSADTGYRGAFVLEDGNLALKLEEEWKKSVFVKNP